MAAMRRFESGLPHAVVYLSSTGGISAVRFYAKRRHAATALKVADAIEAHVVSRASQRELEALLGLPSHPREAGRLVWADGRKRDILTTVNRSAV